MSEKLKTQIQVTEDSILIRNLEIRLYEAIDYLQQLPEYEHEEFCKKALEIGFFCLQRSSTRNELDFIQQKFDALLNELYDAVDNIPNSLEIKLLNKLGTEDGQLLAPIRQQITLTSVAINAQLKAVSEFLYQEFNPEVSSSVFSSAITKIQNLLNDKRSDSLQGVFASAIANVTKENGTLVNAVKGSVNEAIRPLADQVQNLSLEIRDQELAKSILEQTTAKGAVYEDIVLKELQVWAKTCGAQISYVGDESRPGDILIKLTSNSFVGTEISIILEARNRESERWGRTKIARHLETAMATHKANAAIFLSSTIRGLGKDIGDFGQGECRYGSWIATHHEMLNVALQFLILRHQLNQERTSNQEIDAAGIEAQVQRIESSLNHIRNINASLTEMDKITDGIREQAKKLRTEVRNSLNSIQTFLQKTQQG